MNDPTEGSASDVRESSNAIHYVTVSITGAIVMILELLGTRIIGPFYGVSLYVWSSLISVTLIGLSVGYWLGGLCADRVPRVRIPHVVAAAGLLIALLPPATPFVLAMTNPLGLRGGAFTSALILFLLPLMLLGMVGPMVIQRATRSLAGVGLASGRVYAISTVGSVVGTILFGFFLLPTLGTRAIVFGLSASLFLLAFALVFAQRKQAAPGPSVHPMIVACFLAICAGSVANSSSDGSQRKVVWESESLYGRVSVLEDPARGVRYLLSDSSMIGASMNGRSTFPYLNVYRAVTDLRPEGKQALLIGLGAGFLSSILEERGVTTDVIEIDPAVAFAAKRYFGYVPTGELIVGDGRYEIRRLEKEYDFIYHDCFTGGAVPAHLLSIEVFAELGAMLRPDGILALNFFGFATGEDTRAIASIQRTLEEVFPYVTPTTSTLDCEGLCDVLFLASNSPMDLMKARKDGPERPKGWLQARAIEIDTTQGVLVTDEFNPLEHIQTRKSEAYREDLVGRIGLEVLGR